MALSGAGRVPALCFIVSRAFPFCGDLLIEIGTRYHHLTLLRSTCLVSSEEWRGVMPRRPRVFLAGASYHVYCRVARGERVLRTRARPQRWSG